MQIPEEVTAYLTKRYGKCVAESDVALDESSSVSYPESTGSYVIHGRVSNKFGYIIESIKKELTNHRY